MLWKKLLTAARGAGSEVGEAIVDAQAFRILDQELRDASAALTRSVRELSGIVALQKGEKRRIADLMDRIEKDEAVAREALAKRADAFRMAARAPKRAEASSGRDGGAALALPTSWSSQVARATPSAKPRSTSRPAATATSRPCPNATITTPASRRRSSRR